MSARTQAAAALVAALIVLVAGVALIDALPVGVFYDDGMYVVLAKALATGHGYHWLHLPNTPAATHFPPGYPALLALAWMAFPAFPANVLAFKALNALLLAAAAAGLVIFALRRLRFTPAGAVLLGVAGCLAVPTLVLSTQVMSETLFLAMLVPALLLAEGTLDETPSPARLLALGLAAGALMLVRSHGLAFAAAVCAALLLRRRWRDVAVVGAVTSVTVLPWQLWQMRHEGTLPVAMRGSYESYGTWLARGVRGDGISMVGRTLAHTMLELWSTITGIVTAGLPVPVRWPLALFAVALACAGWVRLRRAAPVSALFIAAYVAVILLWPFAPSRFLWGIWPLALMLAALGAVALRDWRPALRSRQVLRLCAAIGVVAAAGGYSVYTARGYRGAWWSSIPRQNAQAVRPLIQWTARNTAPGAVIASNVEVMLFLYTGRASVPAMSFSVDDFSTPAATGTRADALRSILRSYRVDAVAIVANEQLAEAARSLAAQQPPTLVLRDSIPNGLIFSPTLR